MLGWDKGGDPPGTGFQEMGQIGSGEGVPRANLSYGTGLNFTSPCLITRGKRGKGSAKCGCLAVPPRKGNYRCSRSSEGNNSGAFAQPGFGED